MEPKPPIKPPRGVKTIRETSGLLMSVIRALSASETNEQRDQEKAKLEVEYKQSNQKIDELILRHENDLTQVIQLFGVLSQNVSEARNKISNVKQNLMSCKSLLSCRRDELKNLWFEGLEYKFMLELLEKVEKINDIPSCLSNYLMHKQYLHATNLLLEAVSLGKGCLEGVEGLKDLSHELESKKENLHILLLTELKHHVYVKPSQYAITLHRQGSGREDLLNLSLQRNVELRLSSRQKFNFKQASITSQSSFDVQEDLNTVDLEKNTENFMAILIKCLALLEKLPFVINKLKMEMQTELLQIIQHTTYYVNDINAYNGITETKQGKQKLLLELMEILFEQFRQVAQAYSTLLSFSMKAVEAHKIDLKLYDMKFFWAQVQAVLQLFLNDYLDIQNVSNDDQLGDNFSNPNNTSTYFSRRKPQLKNKTLFKFDGSSSALANNDSSAKNIEALKNTREKILVCLPDPNNISVIFIPLMYFINEIEEALGLNQGVSCSLHLFISNYVTDSFIMRKQTETLGKIDMAVRAADAWKATTLLDVTTDYKPLLVSTVKIEKCVWEWHHLLEALPLFAEQVVKSVCIALKEYKETCFAAYQGIVQPHSEDRRICSAMWLKDEDISRFLKSLPNWLNLKAKQEHQARNERKKNLIRKDNPSEEESPEDIKQRNRREAEILAGNLGEGGVGSGEIISDTIQLKELAQLQESMEWFSVRMLQFASEFRQDPFWRSSNNGASINDPPPVSPSVLQQLTSLAQDFDELANTCLLLLHLEVRVQCFHYLLAQSEYNKETHEPDPKVLELSRVLANVDEAMTSSLHSRKCKYIFEGLGHLIAKILISSAQQMKIIDETGIQRICRNIFALQQTLTNITMTREVALDHARHYFELFFLTPEEILNGIMEKGSEFSELEYINAFYLLNRSRSKSRDINTVNSYLQKLSNILNEVGVTV